METNDTVACGTTKHNRLNPPKTKKLLHGEHSFRRDRNPLMIQYQDKKEIYFSINYSSSEISIFRKKKKKWHWGIQACVSQQVQQLYGWNWSEWCNALNLLISEKATQVENTISFSFYGRGSPEFFILYNKVVGNERLFISCQSKLLSISLQNLVGIFLSWYLDQEGKPILQKHVQYVQRMRNIKKADTSAKIVPKIQDFV